MGPRDDKHFYINHIYIYIYMRDVVLQIHRLKINLLMDSSRVGMKYCHKCGRQQQKKEEEIIKFYSCFVLEIVMNIWFYIITHIGWLSGLDTNKNYHCRKPQPWETNCLKWSIWTDRVVAVVVVVVRRTRIRDTSSIDLHQNLDVQITRGNDQAKLGQ